MNDQRTAKRWPPNRRDMLKLAGSCGAMTNMSLLSTLFQLSATNAAVAADGDLDGYKAIVCLFLFGGNDSFNTLAPYESQEHTDYLAARGGDYNNGNGALGLPTSELLPITDSVSARQFGVHNSMPEVQSLYNAGKLTFLSNVGSLVEPTTMAEYQSRSNLPLGLFSHADHQRHWQTNVPQTRSQVTGWCGRMADIVNASTNSNDVVSMNIALHNINLLQTGTGVTPYVIGEQGAIEIQNYNQPWTRETIFRRLNDNALTRPFDNNLLEKTFVKQNKNSLDAAIDFNIAANATKADVDSHFADPGTWLSRQLRMVARSIRAQDALGQRRQIFMVSHHGYDNHDELINNHSYNMMEVSQAMASFQSAMDANGMADKVVLFTASDFARTLGGNGRGSDHAWGSNQMIMGGPVQGGRIYGDYPASLAPGNPLDLGRGRLLPTTSVDELACELAMWFGLSNDGSMVDILPNIRNFHGAGTNKPIGCLA